MSPNLFKSDAPPGASDPEPPRATVSKASEKTRRKERSEPASISVLGSGLTIEGEVMSRGDVQIEGTVKGNLTSEGQVSVAAPGSIEGEVSAERVIVAGRVEGKIKAREGARLVDGAHVDADVTSPRLELEDGATLNGRVEMSSRESKPKASHGPDEAVEPKQGAA